jgi:glycosyltransferase involved in cell wall biosynthesis
VIIGKIWDSEYPWDVRVEKVCRTLREAGHEVHLACRNRRREAEREELEYATVHRMPPVGGFLGRWNGALSFPAFVNPRWFRLVRRAFAKERADLILCRDLPLSPLALWVGRTLRIPVVLDIAEHYPGMLSDLYNARDFRVSNLLIRNPIFASWLERLTLPRADAVIVVVEEMAERLVKMGVPRARLAVVSNTPVLGRSPARSPRPGGKPRKNEPLRIVYFGNVEYPRGLNVVQEAVALLKAEGVVVRFDVYGDGKDFESEKARARRLQIEDRVAFHGRRPYSEILERLGEFDAGIIPHHANDHCSFTVPNKLFDCMEAGLPVLVSSMPPAQRIMKTTGAGLEFRDRDPEDLAQVLREFPGSEERARMSEAGRRAVQEEFNWGLDAKRLVDVVEGAASRG